MFLKIKFSFLCFKLDIFCFLLARYTFLAYFCLLAPIGIKPKTKKMEYTQNPLIMHINKTCIKTQKPIITKFVHSRISNHKKEFQNT